MRLSTVTLATVLAITTSLTAQAAPVILPNGTTVNIDPSGAVTGALNCTYDAVTGQVSGAAACATSVTGTALRNIEQQVTAARVNLATRLQSDSNLRMFNSMIDQRVGANAVINIDVSTGTPATGGWAGAAGSFIGDNRVGFEKDGHNYAATVGVDHISGSTTIGGTVGYTKTDIDLKSLQGNLSSDGWLVGLYVTQKLNDVFSITGSGSYAHSNIDLRRTFQGAQVTSNFGHNEYSASVSGNGFWQLGTDAGFGAMLGLSHGINDDDAYTDSRGIAFGAFKENSTWAKGGASFAFNLSNPLRPYVSATYSRLLSARSYQVERNALSVGGGLALRSGNIGGSLGVETVLLQSGQHETSVGLSLRISL